MKVILASTYELGRQPFGLASPAAWLRAAGHSVTCADLSCAPIPKQSFRDADIIAFHLPMHTATRLAVNAIRMVREVNPRAHLCCYGLYAPANEDYLRSLGVGTILAGEYEPSLVRLAERLARGDGEGRPAPVVSLERLQFRVPDRSDLPALDNYAALVVDGAAKRVGYTEASRGCKHLCCHCPVVPVYRGTFRIVQPDVVLEDIRRQIRSGAEHVTFGDPDFFNGPVHAHRIVEAFHAEFPEHTYDVTIKVEHLLKHRDLLPVLRRTGCLFVTTAVESAQDEVLAKLDKGHTRSDFIRVVRECRKAGLTLAPTFVPFTPWTTWEGYRDLLALLVGLDLVDSVAPVQLALRLLIPGGSRLLELPEIRELVAPFDAAGLVHPWKHPDPEMDRLSAGLLRMVAAEERHKTPRRQIFARVWERSHAAPLAENFDLLPRSAVPYLNEPWYC